MLWRMQKTAGGFVGGWLLSAGENQTSYGSMASVFLLFSFKFLDFIFDCNWYHDVDQQWDWTFPQGFVTI